ncbi:unnamed protein product [marine sediment metagenome]|uniref:Uncharacterized protein n=1 Tax=marine sediment metagenome TaxID=412755 RepID=X1RG29_9ZZZZ
MTGFIVGLLFSNNIISHNSDTLLRIAAIAFLIPITIGVWIAINESKNFRLKYKTSRLVKRYDDPEKNENFKKIEIDCTCLEKLNR